MKIKYQLHMCYEYVAHSYPTIHGIRFPGVVPSLGPYILPTVEGTQSHELLFEFVGQRKKLVILSSQVKLS